MVLIVLILLLSWLLLPPPPPPVTAQQYYLYVKSCSILRPHCFPHDFGSDHILSHALYPSCPCSSLWLWSYPSSWLRPLLVSHGACLPLSKSMVLPCNYSYNWSCNWSCPRCKRTSNTTCNLIVVFARVTAEQGRLPEHNRDHGKLSGFAGITQRIYK